jgi:hypothetical protein
MKRRTTSAELNEVGRRVAGWREEHGGRGSRIPDELWKAAAGVAQVEGVWRTAKALRFNYEALRERVRQGGSGDVAVEGSRKIGGKAATRAGRAEVPASGSTGARFIALELGQLGGAGRTVIDLVGRQGDRMRVDVVGGVDLAGLVQAFWSRQP